MIYFILWYVFGLSILLFAEAKLNDSLSLAEVSIHAVLGAWIWSVSLLVVLVFSKHQIVIWEKKK